MEVREDSRQHILMNKQESMGASIESICDFGVLGLLVNDSVNHVYDLFRELI